MTGLRSRRGFTQVEILVTIVVILSLASLILPLLSKTKEVARGSQCKDHLHNLVIAVQNYEQHHAMLPPGALVLHRPVRSEPGGDGFSWLARLLPFVEQRPIYDMLDWSLPIDRQQHNVVSVQINVFHCPSDGQESDEWNGTSSYAGVHHHREAAIDVDNHGLFVLGRGISMTDILDGESHTFLIGEKEILAGDRGWLSCGRATLRNTGAGFSRFTTQKGGERPSSPIDPLAVGSFSSAHPYGVHMVLADSAVRLMSFESELEVLQRLADRADGELIDATVFLPEHLRTANNHGDADQQ